MPTINKATDIYFVKIKYNDYPVFHVADIPMSGSSSFVVGHNCTINMTYVPQRAAPHKFKCLTPDDLITSGATDD